MTAAGEGKNGAGDRNRNTVSITPEWCETVAELSRFCVALGGYATLPAAGRLRGDATGCPHRAYMRVTGGENLARPAPRLRSVRYHLLPGWCRDCAEAMVCLA